MKKKEAVLIFDIGKTKKKAVLFDRGFNVIESQETMIEEAADDEGFPCEDAERLESWIDQVLYSWLDSTAFQLRGVNFSTYGATLVCLDENGDRFTPIYNYLKPLPAEVLKGFYNRYGGVEEFCRRTASPELGMLNSGLQLLWMKRARPDIFNRIRDVLHLPQYLSYRMTRCIASELTSVGCHTMLLDFDTMEYHEWIREEGISLPGPGEVSSAETVTLGNRTLEVGVGIHDSSASLVPFLLSAPEPFILLSTGTWCISMNPFNDQALTAEELSQDCLCFLSVQKKPVKSSRFFLGRIHDLNLHRLASHFQVEKGAYERVNPGTDMFRKAWLEGREDPFYFKEGIPEGLVDKKADLRRFRSFGEAYLRLMVDLTRRVKDSIDLILSAEDLTRHLYITGGFSRNPLFTTMIAAAFPGKRVFTSEVENASSLGAALVTARHMWDDPDGPPDLRLHEIIV